ncbi:MAG TPA: hypothetical protein DCM70_00645 [Rhodobacteraceae bacterium]|nr:hypothetical protein [Paracoccaceae bacterium]
MFIWNCWYAEKSWLMHNHLRFCAVREKCLDFMQRKLLPGYGRFWRESFRLDLLRGSSLGCRIVL